jgi:hypothetical protein
MATPTNQIDQILQTQLQGQPGTNGPNVVLLPPKQAEAPTVKSGWFTTEHILTYVAMILTTLYAANVIPTDGVAMKIALVCAIQLTSMGYTVSRTMLKASAHKVSIAEGGAATMIAQSAIASAARARRAAGQAGFISLRPLLALAVLGCSGMLIALQVSAFTGCAATTSAARTMSGEFATCAKADLGQVIKAVPGELLSGIAAIIAANSATLENDLTKIALEVGKDAVTCGISAVAAVVNPSHATPKTGQDPIPKGLSRALAWEKAQ